MTLQLQGMDKNTVWALFDGGVGVNLFGLKDVFLFISNKKKAANHKSPRDSHFFVTIQTVHQESFL